MDIITDSIGVHYVETEDIVYQLECIERLAGLGADSHIREMTRSLIARLSAGNLTEKFRGTGAGHPGSCVGHVGLYVGPIQA